jgi:hypothetical protein
LAKIDPLSWVIVTNPLEDGKRRAIHLDGRIDIIPDHLGSNDEIAAYCGVTGARRWGAPEALTMAGVLAVSRQNAERVKPRATDLQTALAGAADRLEGLLNVWVNEPLASQGFKRQARRWIAGSGDVRPIVAVNEQSAVRMTEGMISFTLEFGVWVRSFAARVLGQKSPRPNLGSAPYSERLGFLLPFHKDHWWLVSDIAVYENGWPPRQLDSPSSEDEVPTFLRTRLVPEMLALRTIRQAVEQCAAWSSQVRVRGSDWAASPNARQLLELAPDPSG